MKKYLIAAIILYFLKMASSFGQPVIIWDKVYGSYSDDWGQQIVALEDGGCAFSARPYIGGDGNVPEARGGARDVWGGRLDANGNLMWSRIFGGSKEDLAGPVLKTDDGGVIFQYFTESDDYDIPERIGGDWDGVFHKINADGQTAWIKLFGCTENELGYGQQIPNGNYLMYLNFGKNDGTLADLPDSVRSAVIEFDQQAHAVWKAPVTFQPGSDQGFHTNVAPTSDGGFVFGVDTDENPDNQGETDLCIWRFSGEKKLLWKKCYGGEDDDYSKEILQLPDGRFAVAGQTRSKNWHITNYHGGTDIWLLLLDKDGNLVSERAIGGSALDIFYKILLSKDGKSVFLLGTTFSNDGDVSYYHGSVDIWLIKVDINTNKIVWEKTYGSSIGQESAVDMSYSPDGSLIVLGEVRGGGQDGDVTDPTYSGSRWDLWIFKLAPEEILAAADCGSFNIAPNPTAGNSFEITFPNLLEINPEIKIFDIRGAMVAHYPEVPLQSTWKTTLDLPGDTPAGVYVVQVYGCNETPQVGKFLKIN